MNHNLDPNFRLSPEAPIVVLVHELTGGKSLEELVRAARWRRKRERAGETKAEAVVNDETKKETL